MGREHEESQTWMEKTQLFGRPIKKIQANKESSLFLFSAPSNLLPWKWK